MKASSENETRRQRAHRLVQYGSFFEIACLDAEDPEMLVGALLNIRKVLDNPQGQQYRHLWKVHGSSALTKSTHFSRRSGAG